MPQRGGIPLVIDSFKAAADLSGVQYYSMKLSAANTVNITSANSDLGVGILQNKPDTAGDAASVMINGISKAVISDTITRNTGLMSHTDGTLMTATNTSPIIAIALESGVTGDIISVILTPGCYLSSS